MLSRLRGCVASSTESESDGRWCLRPIQRLKVLARKQSPMLKVGQLFRR